VKRVSQKRGCEVVRGLKRRRKEGCETENAYHVVPGEV
jgi:hypothetical protein